MTSLGNACDLSYIRESYLFEIYFACDNDILVYEVFFSKATLLLRQCVNKALIGSASQKVTNPANWQRSGHKIP